MYLSLFTHVHLYLLICLLTHYSLTITFLIPCLFPHIVKLRSLHSPMYSMLVHIESTQTSRLLIWLRHITVILGLCRVCVESIHFCLDTEAVHKDSMFWTYAIKCRKNMHHQELNLWSHSSQITSFQNSKPPTIPLTWHPSNLCYLCNGHWLPIIYGGVFGAYRMGPKIGMSYITRCICSGESKSGVPKLIYFLIGL